MKKLFVLLILWIWMIPAQAQMSSDAKLSSLVEIVKQLRNPSEKSFNKAFESLKADESWISMSETGKLQDSECKPSKRSPGFKLNRILYTAERERKYVSTKTDMLNGEDSRYYYSLYERSLKKGKSSTYHLKKRNGKQTIVLVPYVAKKGSLTVLVDGKKTATTESEDGTVTCTFQATGKEFSLTVTNKSESVLPFVILNHNSRKK